MSANNLVAHSTKAKILKKNYANEQGRNKPQVVTKRKGAEKLSLCSNVARKQLLGHGVDFAHAGENHHVQNGRYNRKNQGQNANHKKKFIVKEKRLKEISCYED